jgi:hypothetical protein
LPIIHGVQQSFALNEVVAESITSIDGQYIQIEDYAALKGLSQAAGVTPPTQMTANRRILAFIFCNLSPLLSIAVKIGSRFNASDKPIHVEGQYSGCHCACIQAVRNVSACDQARLF